MEGEHHIPISFVVMVQVVQEEEEEEHMKTMDAAGAADENTNGEDVV